MSINIGSFNVLNFNTNTNKDKNFKTSKAKSIAQIISNNQLDIIALQEIQTQETIEMIMNYLPEKFNCFGSQEPYKKLNNEKYLSKSNNNFKSEYAFIYDSSKIKLSGDIFLYKGIYDSISKQLDIFSNMLMGAIMLLIGKWAWDKAKANDKKINDRDKRIGATVGAGATAIVATELVAQPILKQQIETILKATLRPPLIGIFERVDGNSSMRIRVINTHIQFGKTKVDEIGGLFPRKAEVAFLLNKIYSSVNSYRDGSNFTDSTIIAGDFNLNTKQIDKLIKNQDTALISFTAGINSDLLVVQEENSTLKIINKEAVKQGIEDPKYDTANNYDHFIYDSSYKNWEDVQLLDNDQNLFFIETDENKRPISDHYPIKITFNKA